MDADDHPVETILAEARRFMVPLYQRKYQWGDERLVPFWEDVEAKASEVLEGESKFQHYMGALILAPIGEGAQIGVTPRVQVVDGQQRLTTFQLFLVALREVARQHECLDIISYVQDYIFNPLKSKDSDPLTRFKLTPTPSDREVFHDILDLDYWKVRGKYGRYYWGTGVPKNTPLRALRAYDEFKKRISRFCQYGPVINEYENDIEAAEEADTGEAIELRLEALLKALLNRMKLVVITLGEDDDAQVIFETLNSKGEPLLAMDLVRNNIFYRAEKQTAQIEELYKELWDPFDAAWWREAAPFARPKRPRIDHFLSHVLTAETGEKISMRELYAEYRAFAVPKGRPRFPNVEDELRLLERHAPTYETLEGRKSSNETIAWLGRKLAAWQVTTAYPVALQIAVANVDGGEKDVLARLIYSYIVRRAMCGLTAKNLNRVFQAIAQRFVESGPSVSTLVEFFDERPGNSTRFPSDQEVRSGLLSKPLYQNAPDARNKDILWELELASRSKLAEKIEMPDGLWTEHVMPVSWTDEWPFPGGVILERSSPDPRVAVRNELLHTIGNLTLISGSLNISSGNKSYSKKKEKFEEHSGLFLNKWFNKAGFWDENSIRMRSQKLADDALKIWLGIEKYGGKIHQT
ncbi:DUF262 domain-containing protein [Roseibium sediminicola]|uniref:DUF262 domain-containing protein n=1 Tax=Roseibium sediminicola TaxID=2933272 RepID=A0ABT0GSE7_9HYPH|nr:DUF262 domain-containing protein [Roseibium sp. CAU 1639]MCK7612366.1 DUF262 domain-containing protein [Roseibium sp. CAU 1639]